MEAPRRAGRSAPLLHAGLALVLAVTVIAVAYGTQASTLGVAEFAPAARQAVEPPPTTASNSPAGGAGQARGHATTTTQPTATATSTPDTGADTAPTTRVGRARACYGNPPRQLPDPRSPACLATIYEGDNSGRTTRGVTETEIRVAWSADERSEATLGPIRAMFEFFNNRFEFYGRRLVLVSVPYPSPSDVVGQRAAAASIAAQDAFASLAPSIGSVDPSWYAEHARQGVIAINSGTWSFLSDRETYDPLHPYVWGVHPSAEQILGNIGSLACTALVGKPARHGGADVREKTRKFGIVGIGTYRAPSTRQLEDQLSACGAETVSTSLVSSSSSADARTTAVARLRDAGATTLVCACANTQGGSFVQAVDQAGWEPEWLYTGLHSPVFDEYLHQIYLSDRQRAHLFGVQPLGVTTYSQNEWWWRALVEAGVADVAGAFPNIRRHVAGVYEQLLVLAAGIQAAGPQLSADTFGQGLMAASFPNTGAGQPPYKQASVGFGPGDHTLYSDYALTWWSPTAEPFGAFSEVAKGSWCYVAGGARFAAGRYPTNADDLFFDPNQPCR